MKGYRSVSEMAKKWGHLDPLGESIHPGRARSWLRAFRALLGSSGGCGEAGATEAWRKKREREEKLS